MMPSRPPPLIHVSEIRSSFSAKKDELQSQVMKQEFQRPTDDVDALTSSNDLQTYAHEGLRVPNGWRVTFQPVLVPASRFSEPQAVPDGDEWHIEIPDHNTCALSREWHISNLAFGCGQDSCGGVCGRHFHTGDLPCVVADDTFLAPMNHTPSQYAQRNAMQLTIPDGMKPLTKIERHNLNKKKSLCCLGCDASYHAHCEMNRRISVSHIRQYKCDVCKRKFGQKNYLRIHVETVHRKERNHQCQTCGKRLSTPGNLKVHIRTIHLGEKKHKCQICSKAFGQRCNLKTHLMRHKACTDA